MTARAAGKVTLVTAGASGLGPTSALVQLSSDGAACMTGHARAVDGGFLARRAGA